VISGVHVHTISVGITDVGLKRSQNEDNFLINDALGLFIVADGMGGHAGGEMASSMAVLAIEEGYSAHTSEPDETRVFGPGERLQDAIAVAGMRVYDYGQQHVTFKGMGTTVVAVAVEGASAIMGHVGDSRCYHWRAGSITQVTNDHSLVNEKIEAGLLSVEEAKTHRLKNVITRSLGFSRAVKVDVNTVDLMLGDQLFLCSDGLSGLVEEGEISKHLASTPPQEAARGLVELALSRGGDDNITIVIVLFQEQQ
jgi:protein phosphatase